MLIRVLEIPKSSGEFCFSGGNSQTWKEVDWFRDDDAPPEAPTMETKEGREEIKQFLTGKNYFSPDKAYLVLHEKHTFTINYKSP